MKICKKKTVIFAYKLSTFDINKKQSKVYIHCNIYKPIH